MDWRILLALLPLLLVSCIYAQDMLTLIPVPATIDLIFDVRLVDGDTIYEGRVEINYLGTWGTVCGDRWDRNDARVICRMLGFGPGVRGYYGPGVGLIWLDEVNCDGSETTIRMCGHNGWGVHNCVHNGDAGVRCEARTPTEFTIITPVTASTTPGIIPCDDSFRVDAVIRLCTPKPMAEQIRNVKDWRAVCKEEHGAIQSRINCLQRSTQCTSSEAEALLSTGSHCFYTMMCDEGVLNPEIQTMLDDARFDQDVIDAIDFTRCMELLNEPNLELRKLHYRLALSCMRRAIDIELTEPNNKLARLVAQLLIDCEASMDDLPPTSDDYDFTLVPRCTMRIWGEPHIETCNDVNKQTTCSAPGLQTYLNLPFLKITGVNTHTNRGMRITLLTEITIEFKSLVPPHPITARYKAASHSLPETFEFRANQVSEIDTVKLTMQPGAYRYGGGHYVVPLLVWPHTGVEIILTIWGSFVQFVMRASQAAMNKGTGILIEGCPDGEELPNMWGRRRRNTAGISKRAEDEANARSACLAMGIPNTNTGDMDACMFDVIAMNDTSIAEATSMSIEDKTTTVSNDAARSAVAGVLSIPTGSEFDTSDCVPNGFLPDPTDCSRYYQCLGYGKALLRKCIPKILRFNLAARRCDWRWNVRCHVVSAGNGP